MKGKKLKDFETGLAENQKITKLKSEVEAWSSTFGYPEPLPALIRGWTNAESCKRSRSRSRSPRGCARLYGASGA